MNRMVRHLCSSSYCLSSFSFGNIAHVATLWLADAIILLILFHQNIDFVCSTGGPVGFSFLMTWAFNTKDLTEERRKGHGATRRLLSREHTGPSPHFCDSCVLCGWQWNFAYQTHVHSYTWSHSLRLLLVSATCLSHPFSFCSYVIKVSGNTWFRLY